MSWSRLTARIAPFAYAVIFTIISGCASYEDRIQPVTQSHDSLPQDRLLFNDWMQYRQTGQMQLLDRKTCSLGERKTLFLVTLSGGGSRAAYFAARVIHELDKLGDHQVTPRIDGIFSVSGGSLAAALYSVSQEPGGNDFDQRDRPVWTEHLTDTALTTSLTGTMAAELAEPDKLAGYLFGNLSRTDLLKRAIERKVFGNSGSPLTFRSTNPARPPVFIMATNATTEGDDAFAPAPFGSVFIFAKPDLVKFGVDISTIPLSTAVAASAAFPGLLSPVTIPRYRLSQREADKGRQRYVHLIDGGNSDNLGLLGVKRALLEDRHRLLSDCESVVVLSVDAFGRQGFHSDDVPHESSPVGLIFDHRSALASFDALLAANRARLLAEFKSRAFMPPGDEDLCSKDGLPDDVCSGGVREDWSEVNRLLKQKLLFVHLNFASPEVLDQTPITHCMGAYGSADPQCEVKPIDEFRLFCERRALRHRVASIPTKFGLQEQEREDIATFVSLLNHPQNQCLRHLVDVVAQGARHEPQFYGSVSASCDETPSMGESAKWPARGRFFGDVIHLDPHKKSPDIDERCAKVLPASPVESTTFLREAKRKLLAQPQYLSP